MAHSFKFKPSKVKFTKEQRTLDEIHRETLEKFDEVEQETTCLKQKIYCLEKKYNTVCLESEKKKITLKIKELKIKLNELLNSNDELDYFEKTRDILLKYYKDDNKVDLGENEFYESESETENNKIAINTTIEEDPLLDRLNKLNDLNNKTIKEKKVKNKKKLQDKGHNKSILSFLSGVDNNNNKESIENSISKIVNDKGTLKEQYLFLTDSKYMCEKVKLSQIKKCTNCNIEKTLIHSEGIYVCQECGEFEYVIIDSEVPSHKDSLNEKPKYPYKTINHLIERLNQFQAKQTTVIPQNIYKIIDVELKKMVIHHENITPDIIKKILKKYRLNLFYEHNYLIFSYITNTPPPSLSRDEEDTVKNMFKETERPFQKYKPGDRANYLNYSYALRKIFFIIGTISNNQETKNRMKNNAKYFSLLKSRDKLRIQDLIWKKICKDLNWPYHPSF